MQRGIRLKTWYLFWQKSTIIDICQGHKYTSVIKENFIFMKCCLRYFLLLFIIQNWMNDFMTMLMILLQNHIHIALAKINTRFLQNFVMADAALVTIIIFFLRTFWEGLIIATFILNSASRRRMKSLKKNVNMIFTIK